MKGLRGLLRVRDGMVASLRMQCGGSAPLSVASFGEESLGGDAWVSRHLYWVR